LQRERDLPCARGRAFLTQQVTDKIGSTSASHSHPTHATRQTSTPSDAPLSSAPLNPQPNTMETKTTNMQPHLENDIVQRLQEENAALKVELQALRSTTQLQAPLSIAHASHEQTFDFLKLPRELRNSMSSALLWERFTSPDLFGSSQPTCGISLREMLQPWSHCSPSTN
jgi:hypothetical protein